MIELSWSDFKTQIVDSQIWNLVYFDIVDHYHIYGKQNDFTVLCKIYKDSGADQTDFEAIKSSIDNKILNNVRTREEREDIRNSICRIECAFDQNDIAEASLVIPAGGLYIAGGEAFTDVFYAGDACTEIKVVDVDNLLGLGAETTIATYHNTSVPTANQGWYFLPNHCNTGLISERSLGFYGFIPEGFYLELYFKKKPASTATTVYINYWMGEQTSG